MGEEVSYTPKEARDLLRYTKKQRVNFYEFPSYVVGRSSSSTEDVITVAEDYMWQYFNELPDHCKFFMIHHILNEKTFKTFLFNLLNMIKASQYQMMNSSFICIRRFIDSVFIESLANISNKSDSGLTTPFNGKNQTIEMNPFFTWNPERSEYVLNNVVTTCFSGGVNQFPAKAENLQIMGSSLMCSAPSQMGLHITSVKQEEMRTIPVHRTTSETVEDKIAAIAKVSKSKSDGDSISFAPLSGTTQYPDIVAFSLSGVIACQIMRGVEYYYNSHLTRVAEATLSTLLTQTPLTSGAPNFMISSPEAERSFVQLHMSTECSTSDTKSQLPLIMTAKFVRSYWETMPDSEKSKFLRILGLLEDSSGGSEKTKSSGKIKGKKGGSTTGKRNSFEGDSVAIDMPEIVRADFRKFAQNVYPQTYSEQELEPLLPSQVDVSNDWWDIEEGTRDNAALNRFEERIKENGRSNDFEMWCLSESRFGSLICEYVCTCPFDKLFTPTSWNTWSVEAFHTMEKKWLREEGDVLLLGEYESLELLPSSGNSNSGKRNSKSKKKQRKSANRKSSDRKICKDVNVVVSDCDHTGGCTGKVGKENNDKVADVSGLVNSENDVEDRQVSPLDTSIVPLSSVKQGEEGDSVVSLDMAKFVGSHTDSKSSSEKDDVLVTASLTADDVKESSRQTDNNIESNINDEMLARSEPCKTVIADTLSNGVERENCPVMDDMKESSIKQVAQLTVTPDDVTRDMEKKSTETSVTSCSTNKMLSPSLIKSTTAGVVSSGDVYEECGNRDDAKSMESCSTTDSEARLSISTSATTTTGTTAAESTSYSNVMNFDSPQMLTQQLSANIGDMAVGLRRLADQRRPWQLGTVEKIKEIVRHLWLHATVDIFGSFSTGLAIPSSDIDIIISGVNMQQMQWFGGRMMSPMAILSQQLQLATWVTTLKLIEKTAMPVIKLTTAPVPIAAKALGPNAVRGIIKVDISFGATIGTPPQLPHHFPTSNGLHPGHILHQGIATRDFVLKLCAMNPAIVPLTLVLKQFLTEKGLHDPYTGGLSSYAMTIMVASILQPYVLEPPHTHPDLGTLLLMFFRKFGTKFDTRKHAVALTVNGPFVPLTADMMPRVGSEGYWNPPDPVVVIDPLNSQNNLGRSCYGFRQLQITFDSALKSTIDSFPQNLDEHTSPLGIIFGAGHHRSVLKLASKLWCPTEISQPEPNLVTHEKNDVVSSHRAFDSGEMNMKEQCIALLSNMSHSQLQVAHRSLSEILAQACREEKEDLLKGPH